MGITQQYGGGGESTGSSKFLKGASFDGEGQKLVVVGMEKFTPEDPKYGVKNEYGAGGVVTKENWFVKEGILEEGQSFKYKFTQDGKEKEFDNSSAKFYFAFSKVDLDAGQAVSIKRKMNSPTDVVWTIEKI